MQLILKVEKSTSQAYFEKNFHHPELEWKVIHTLPKRVTNDTNCRIFQFKLLHSIFYLNEIL